MFSKFFNIKNNYSLPIIPRHEIIDEIANTSVEKILQGEIDHKINHILDIFSQKDDLNLFMMLLYALFSKKHSVSYFDEDDGLRSALYYYQKQPSPRLKNKVINEFKDFLNWVKVNRKLTELEDPAKSEYVLKMNRTRGKAPHWGEKFTKPIDGDEVITIVHGGGFFYLHDWLNGNIFGYPLEYNGTGIQVSPYRNTEAAESIISESRASCYSSRALHKFDKPAIFSAKIKAKYLDRANNAYEAGLRASSIPYLMDVRIIEDPKSYNFLSDSVKYYEKKITKLCDGVNKYITQYERYGNKFIFFSKAPQRNFSVALIKEKLSALKEAHQEHNLYYKDAAELISTIQSTIKSTEDAHRTGSLMAYLGITQSRLVIELNNCLDHLKHEIFLDTRWKNSF